MRQLDLILLHRRSWRLPFQSQMNVPDRHNLQDCRPTLPRSLMAELSPLDRLAVRAFLIVGLPLPKPRRVGSRLAHTRLVLASMDRAQANRALRNLLHPLNKAVVTELHPLVAPLDDTHLIRTLVHPVDRSDRSTLARNDYFLISYS